MGEQLLDVVVEAGLRDAERRGELLHGPGGILALDHRLQDPDPGRVAERAERLGIADLHDRLGPEVRVELEVLGG